MFLFGPCYQIKKMFQVSMRMTGPIHTCLSLVFPLYTNMSHVRVLLSVLPDSDRKRRMGMGLGMDLESAQIAVHAPCQCFLQL